MRGLTCALIATFFGGLLSCSDEGQATQPNYLYRKSEYVDRGERVRWPQQGHGSVSGPQRAWRRDVPDEAGLERAWAREFDDEGSWEHSEDEVEARHGGEARHSGEAPRHRHPVQYRVTERYHDHEELGDDEEDDVIPSGSHSIPEKVSKKHGGHGGHGGHGYHGNHKKRHYVDGGLTLNPKDLSIVCSVKDPLEHIVWLRSPCPDEYERGDVVARGSSTHFPEVFSVSVSGENGDFSSTLTILKPRDIMGSGVFRCEAWPHFSEHRRHRSLENSTNDDEYLDNIEDITTDNERNRRDTSFERIKRSSLDPWNAVILGGAEMVEECFFGHSHYGDKYRKFRAMNSARSNNVGLSIDDIPALDKSESSVLERTSNNNFFYQPQENQTPVYPQYEKVDVVPLQSRNNYQPESYQPNFYRPTQPSPVYKPQQSDYSKYQLDTSSYQQQETQNGNQYYQLPQPNYQVTPSPTPQLSTLSIYELKKLHDFYMEIEKNKNIQSEKTEETNNHDNYYNRDGLEIKTNMKHKSSFNPNGEYQYNSHSSGDSNSGLNVRTNLRHVQGDGHRHRRAESRVINVLLPNNAK